MKKQLFTLVSLFIFPLFAKAQDFKDCSSAMQICDKQTINFDYSEGIGNVTDFEGICFDGQFTIAEGYSSLWLEWQIDQPGDFYFTITPDNDETDLDFYVFQKTNLRNCDDKTVIRCMSSGAIAGAPPSSWESCVGATGLSPDETDTEEFSGCRSGDNNFVAALDCLPGESYALAITNFSQDSMGFKIEFFGSAKLTCEAVSVSTKNDLSKSLKAPPNPAGDFVNFEFSIEKLETVSLTIFDATGKPIANVLENEKLVVGNFRERFQTNGLTNGLYFYSLKTEEGVVTNHFVIKK